MDETQHKTLQTYKQGNNAVKLKMYVITMQHNSSDC